MSPDSVRRRRLSQVSIQSKLLLMLLLTSVFSAAIVGAIGYQSGRSSLRGAVFDRLTEIRDAQTHQLETQVADLKNSMVIYTRGSTATSAMEAFSRGFAELNNATIAPQQQQQIVDYYSGRFAPLVQKQSDLQIDVSGVLPQSNPQKYLQAFYTAPFTSDRHAIEVDDARDGSSWTAANARFNEFFREIVKRFDFDDALLIDPLGNVVYSAYKGVDLGTNILAGPYRDADLSRTLEEVLTANTVDHVALTDFSKYLPAYGKPTAWMMSPIGPAGGYTGVLALQFPIAKINRAMTFGKDWQGAGLGRTGEALLVGPDELMRSDSRLFLEDPERFKREVIDAGTPPEIAEASLRQGGTTLVQPVGSEAADRARRGQSGTAIDVDYLGRRTLAAYAPVDVSGLHWIMLAKIDTDEAFAPVSAFTKRLVFSTALIIFLVCVASMVLARMFVRPIHRLEAGAQRISTGDYDTVLPVLTRDELGDLTASFNEMSRNLRVKDDLLAEQHKENDRLLLSLMPEALAERYRQGEDIVAQDHRDVTVVFADIIGLDELSTMLSSDDLVEVMNRLVRRIRCRGRAVRAWSRVRTTRSGYLASCGLHLPRSTTLAARSISRSRSARSWSASPPRPTIGLPCAPASTPARSPRTWSAAPVSIYDMWGSAVNLAYQAQRGPREPGIFVTTAVYEAMRDVHRFNSAGEITVGSPPGATTVSIWQLQELG